jgi:3'-phosphoadenosine 5'-phosphosulfate sulfotransferase (PAPS reductase)/FAD synthetase
MADRDPIQPIHEPTLAVVDEESAWVQDAADRFEDASAQDLLEWAIETFHPRLAISAAGGVDGMAIVDMAWRIDPSIRVFTLDTGRLPAETYTLFEEVRDRYGIDVEFEVPDASAVASFQTANGPNAMYRSVDLRTTCCTIRNVDRRASP